MYFSPSFWIFVYLIQLLLLSLALGSWTIHQPRLLMVPRLSRFLIGFCISPFIVGVWMLLIAAILPGASRWVFLIPPSVTAIIVLGLYGRRTLRFLTQDFQRTHKFYKKSPESYVIYLGTLLILTIIVTKLVANEQSVILAHDGLVYLSRALSFAQERTIDATTDFRGSTDGTISGSSHHFLFPAYLSYALITTNPHDSLGYPNDHAARTAFQVTIIYMLLSVGALAQTARRLLGTTPLAILLLLQVPQLEYMSYSPGRDSFRIIPLVLLGTALIGLSPQRMQYKLQITALLPPLILAAFSLAGHTLGGFVVVTMTLAWFIWVTLQKPRWLNILLVLIALGIGLLVSSEDYFDAYIETASFRGYGQREGAIEETILENIPPKQERTIIAYNSTLPQRIMILLKRDQFRLSIPGFLGAVLVLFLWTRFKQNRQVKPIVFISFTVIFTTLPVFGLFDYKNYQLSKAFVGNFRYLQHWYPFAAVGLAMLISYWYHSLTTRYCRSLIKPVLSFLFILLASTITFSAYQIIESRWRTPSISRDIEFAKTTELLESTLQQIPATKKLLLEDDRYNYYLNNQAIVMYSRPTWSIIHAQNDSEVAESLKNLNIGAVVFQEENIYGWWNQIALFDFLSNPNNAFVSECNDVFRIYTVDEELAHQHQIKLTQAQPYLKAARAYYQQGQILQSYQAYQQAETILPEIGCELSDEEQKLVAQIKNLPQFDLVDARRYLQEGRRQESFLLYQKMIALHPEVINILTPDEWQFITDQTGPGQPQEDSQKTYWKYLAQARIYYIQGHLEESWAAFQQAEALYPKLAKELTSDERQLVAQARLYFQQHKFEGEGAESKIEMILNWLAEKLNLEQ